MKNNLFLAITIALSLPISALDNSKMPELADKAYKAFLKCFKTADASDIETLKNSDDYKQLKCALEGDLAVYNNYKENRVLNINIKISEPVLTFANILKNKLSDKDQLFKDLEIDTKDQFIRLKNMGLLGDKDLIISAESLTINNYGYFAILKTYDLHPVFLYTLDNLTSEQKDIINMADKLGDIYNIWAIEYYTPMNSFSKRKLKAYEKKHVEIKNSKLMQKLIDEFQESIKLYNSGKIVETNKSAPNFKLFYHTLVIKFSNVEEFLRKFNITNPDQISFYKRSLQAIQNLDLILNGLGFFPSKKN